MFLPVACHNKTIEKAMELMLLLKQKIEAQSQDGAPMTEVEMVSYVAAYEHPSNPKMEIFIKDGELFFKAGINESPLKKIGNLRFGIVTQSRSRYFEFVLVPGPDSKGLYQRRGLRAWKRAPIGM